MSVQGRKIQEKKAKNLESTEEKVRAIKERQSQWMKERNEARGSKPLGSAKSMESMEGRSKKSSVQSSSGADFDLDKRKSSASNATYNRSRDNPYSNPRRKPLYTAPKRDHSNIISWSNKGENVGKTKRPPSGQSKINPAFPEALDNRRSNFSNTVSLKGKTYEPSNYKGYSKNLESYSQSSHNTHQPISTNYGNKSNDIDTREETAADDDGVTSNVSSNVDENNSKSNIINNRTTVGSEVGADGLNQDMINMLAETVAQRLKTTIRGSRKVELHSQQTKEHDDCQEMLTHLCPVCNSLMSGSRHTPMALIPCGHTLCQLCLRDCKKCPTCQSRVTSSAVNTVLQQIIADFIAQKEKKKLEKMEMETRKYVDEYQSLSLRSSALAEEADEILNGMEDLTEQLFQEKKILKRVKASNEELTQKIQELQNQLEKNKLQMTETKERCENLECQYEEEKQRLALIEDTVKTIRQSKERVKMLIHNFAPSLNLEQFD